MFTPPIISYVEIGGIINIAQQNLNNKIVIVNEEHGSSIRNKEGKECVDQYPLFPSIRSLDTSLKLDFNMINGKPFFIREVNWVTTEAIYTEIDRIFAPADFLINNVLNYPFQASQKYRLKVKLDFQVLGTPQHGGCLIVAAVPADGPIFDRRSLNSFLAAPHVFLYPNEATPASLCVPFYSNTRVRGSNFVTVPVPIYTDTDNYCNIVFGVMTPLVASASSTTAVNIAVYATFEMSEFYIPGNADSVFHPQAGKIVTTALDALAGGVKKVSSDFIDLARGTVRAYTGLHNPNNSEVNQRVIVANRNMTNVTDVPTFVEKLDPFAHFQRVIDEPIFYTDVDEMLITNILKKRQYIGNFEVSATNQVGELVWSRPITMIQEKFDAIQPLTTLQAGIASCTKWWRGDMEIHIQSTMTNFQACKLLVLKDYSCTKQWISNTRSFDACVAMMTETIEFSGGGQIATIKLPFVSELNQIQHSFEAETNALSHGIYAIYIVSPLVQSGGSPTSAKFNVYMNMCDNAVVYGYATSRMSILPHNSEGLFAAESRTLVTVSDDSDLTNDKDNTNPNIDAFNMRPVLHLRDMLRRYIHVGNYTYTSDTLPYDQIRIPIIDLFKLDNNNKVSFLRYLRRCYLGISGGLKFKLYLGGAGNYKVTYLPPDYYIETAVSGRELVRASHIYSANSTVRSEQYTSFDFPDDSSLALLGTGAGAKDLNPSPFIETASVLNGTNSVIFPGIGTMAGTQINQPAGVSIIECEVPYMSALDFIGDGRVYGSSPSITYSSSMGFLLISYSRSDLIGGAPTHAPLLYVGIYMAFADETRLGFQVFAPSFLPDTTAAAPDIYLTGPYHDAAGAPHQFGTASIAPGAYVGGY